MDLQLHQASDSTPFSFTASPATASLLLPTSVQLLFSTPASTTPQMADQTNQSRSASPVSKKPKLTPAPIQMLTMAAQLMMAQAPAGPSNGNIRNKNLLYKTLTKTHLAPVDPNDDRRQLRPRNDKRVVDELPTTTLAMILDHEETEAKRLKRHLRQTEDLADYTSYSNQLLRMNFEEERGQFEQRLFDTGCKLARRHHQNHELSTQLEATKRTAEDVKKALDTERALHKTTCASEKSVRSQLEQARGENVQLRSDLERYTVRMRKQEVEFNYIFNLNNSELKDEISAKERQIGHVTSVLGRQTDEAEANAAKFEKERDASIAQLFHARYTLEGVRAELEEANSQIKGLERQHWSDQTVRTAHLHIMNIFRQEKVQAETALAATQQKMEDERMVHLKNKLCLIKKCQFLLKEWTNCCQERNALHDAVADVLMADADPAVPDDLAQQYWNRLEMAFECPLTRGPDTHAEEDEIMVVEEDDDIMIID